jgi:hypothetical protein
MLLDIPIHASHVGVALRHQCAHHRDSIGGLVVGLALDADALSRWQHGGCRSGYWKVLGDREHLPRLDGGLHRGRLDEQE